MKRAMGTALVAAMTLPVLLTTGATLAAPAKSPASAPGNFADAAFANVWTRTDSLVDSGSGKRSYVWGPTAGFTVYEQP